MDLNYHSIESLLKAAKENNCRLSALVLEQQAEQMELPKQEIYKKMRENYRVMASCIQPGSAPDLKSTSGLTGGDAYRMRTAVEQGKNLTGPLLGGALYRALAVSELNASMGRIVAAPTAGSCGIVPAAVLTMQEQYQLTEEECVMSLFTASAVGMVIANNAKDLYGALLVVGIMAHIAIQVVLNIAVVTNSIPNTGITLPFISYGGTSASFLLAEMGLALSVSRGIQLEG